MIFLLPVWPEMAVSGLFSPVIRVLRCIVTSRLAQSATGRQPMTEIILLVQREVNIRRRRSQEVLFCLPGAFGLLTCGFRDSNSISVKPEVVISPPEVVLRDRK